MIRDLVIVIIRDGQVPADWEQNFIVCLYKEKGDMLWTEAFKRTEIDGAGYESHSDYCWQPH